LWLRWGTHARLRKRFHVHKSRVPFHSYQRVRRSTAKFPCRFETAATNTAFLVVFELSYPYTRYRPTSRHMILQMNYPSVLVKPEGSTLVIRNPATGQVPIRPLPSTSHPHKQFPQVHLNIILTSTNDSLPAGLLTKTKQIYIAQQCVT